MKAQIHLLESTMVLFVFFFMIILGLVIYTNIQGDKLDVLEQQFDQQRAVSQAQRLLIAPEIACSNANIPTRDCFEVVKLEKFISVIQDNPRYYREKFGTAKVSVTLVYGPSLTNMPGFFINNDTQVLFDFSSGLESKQTFYFPVTLRDERFVPEKNYFGWVTVEAYHE